MGESCLICHTKPSFVQNPESQVKVLDLICELYNFTNHDLVGDLQNEFISFCSSCYDHLTQLDPIWQEFKLIQEKVKRAKEVLDTKIRDTMVQIRNPTKNAIDIFRQEIQNAVHPAVSESPLSNSNITHLDQIEEFDPFIPLINYGDNEEERGENYDEDFKPFLNELNPPTENANMSLQIPDFEKECRAFSGFRLKEPLLNLIKLPRTLPFDEQLRISIKDPSIKKFVKNEKRTKGIKSSRVIKRACKSRTITKKKNRKLKSLKLKKVSRRPKKIKPKSPLYMNTHTLKHQCPICAQVLLRRIELPKHLLQIHGSNSKCQICNREYADSSNLIQHLKLHNKSKNFTCPIDSCKRKFAIERYMIKHMEQMHPNPEDVSKFSCEECPRSFPTNLQLKNHTKAVHPEQLFYCTHPDCKRSYKTISALYLHKRSHQGSRDFLCELCSASFTQKASLDKHMKRSHFAIKPICDVCGQTLLDEEKLRNHKKQIHEKEFRFFCSFCGKGYYAEHQLNQHMKIHLLSHSCEICHRRFANLHNLRDHQISHSEAKTFECNLCDRSFKRDKNLKDHISVIHSDSRPYSCDCGRDFKTKRYLAEHKLKKSCVKKN